MKHNNQKTKITSPQHLSLITRIRIFRKVRLCLALSQILHSTFLVSLPLITAIGNLIRWFRFVCHVDAVQWSPPSPPPTGFITCLLTGGLPALLHAIYRYIDRCQWHENEVRSVWMLRMYRWLPSLVVTSCDFIFTSVGLNKTNKLRHYRKNSWFKSCDIWI
jgi:hypothetical protein